MSSVIHFFFGPDIYLLCITYTTRYLQKVMVPKCDLVTNVWSFPKLTEQNYFTWSKQMKATLQARYLWQYVTRNKPKPPKPLVFPSRLTTSSEPISLLPLEDQMKMGTHFSIPQIISTGKKVRSVVVPGCRAMVLLWV